MLCLSIVCPFIFIVKHSSGPVFPPFFTHAHGERERERERERDVCSKNSKILSVRFRSLQLAQEAFLKKTWFALIKKKDANIDKLRNLLRFLAHKSSKLLHHVVNFIDQNVSVRNLAGWESGFVVLKEHCLGRMC